MRFSNKLFYKKHLPFSFVGKNWFIYLLECNDNSYYTGITNNIKKRMDSHKNGNGSKYVWAKGFKKLLKVKSCKDKSEASKFECFVKSLNHFSKLDWFNN